MSVSACLIAKNEENNIGKCLESLYDVVDEIIVVDTGSTDSTVDIAKKYNSKIVDFPWNNSFSDARNAGIDEASGDWILIIDCDEVVNDSSKEIIKNLSNNTENIEGFGVLITSIIGGIESYCSVHVRFFRNKPGYRYEGIIHEQITDSIVRLKPDANFLKSQITFTHYGYENDEVVQARKSKRNLDLLNAVDEEKRDGMYYCHLGAEYVRLNDFKKASEIFIKGYKISNKTSPFFTQLAHNTVDALVKDKQYEKCIIYCEDILKHFNDFKSVYLINGLCYLNIGQNHMALNNLLMYKTTVDNPFKYPKVDYESNNDIDGLIQVIKEKLNL